MSGRLRVLIAGPYPRKEGIRVGGVQVYTDYLSRGLAARGDMDVHVMTAVDGINSTRETRNSAGVTVHQVPLCPRYQFLTDTLLNVPRMRAVIREIEPDIVHVQTQRFYPMAALERGFPSVVTIHGVYFEESKLAKDARERFRGIYGRMVERNTLKRARHVICLNSYALGIMRPFLRTSDIRLIDNAVDERFFDVVRMEEPGRILFAGLITERKNVLGLLEAVEIAVTKYPGLRLRVAGHVLDQDYFDICRSFVEQNNLEGNVEFLGNVPADDMVDELSKANALVLPAKQETSPMIISEAMAAGLPVIATPVGGMPEVVRDNDTGFIVPLGDADALADRIVELIANSELRAKMGDTARGIARERFRGSAVVEKTVEFYHDILRHEGHKPIGRDLRTPLIGRDLRIPPDQNPHEGQAPHA